MYFLLNMGIFQSATLVFVGYIYIRTYTVLQSGQSLPDVVSLQVASHPKPPPWTQVQVLAGFAAHSSSRRMKKMGDDVSNAVASSWFL